MSERLVPGQAIGGFDVNCPGEVCGEAVEFLVEKIAPSAYGLSQYKTGSGDIKPAQDVQFLPSGVNKH